MPTRMQLVQHLLGKIEQQKRYAQPFERRYRNEHVLPFIRNEYREVYGSQVDTLTPSLHPPLTGTAAIGIDALVERLSVAGVESDDDAAKKIVADAWEDSDLDVMHREAHREAFIARTSFAQVSRSTDGRAIVGIESSSQMAIHRMQAPPYDVDAALKVWTDEWTGRQQGRLWLPGVELDLVQSDVAQPDPEGSQVTSRWVVSEERITGLPGVPVVEFSHRPRLLADPSSEIEPIATLVDIVDLIEGVMVFAGHFGAVPIRTITGLNVPRDPKNPNLPLIGPNGKPAIGFDARADHLWYAQDKDARFGQLTPAGLGTFVEWSDHVTSRIQAKTAVPDSYYGIGPKTHMSAELLKTSEAPLVRRVLSLGRDGSFGQGWRRVNGWILAIEAPSSRARVRSRWADPETRVESQAMDSFQKAVASGMGVRTAAEKILGWSPELVKRAVDEANEAALGDPLERLAQQLPRAARDEVGADA